MKNREQKLEAAFLQFIADVADMRRKQKDLINYPANELQQAQAIVDKDLKQMGITDETALSSLNQIDFI